jgi:hypothetical protein
MNVSLPFIYSVSFRFKGKDRISRTVATGSVFSNVPEISSDETEVAARWNSQGFDNEVLLWNGDLYRRANDPRDRPIEVGAFNVGVNPFSVADNLSTSSGVLGFNDWWGKDGQVLRRALGGVERPLSLARGAEPIDSTEGASRAAAQRLADGLVFIDGVLWHRIPGVLLALSTYPGSADSTAFVTIPPYGGGVDRLLNSVEGEQNPTFVRYFNLDESDPLDGEGRPLSFDFEDLEILRPEARSYDGRSEFAARIMNSAVRISAFRLGEMAQDNVARWTRMRDAVGEWYAASPAVIDEVAVEALFAFVRSGAYVDSSGWLQRGCSIIEDYDTVRTPTLAVSPLSP